ncbi:hypothetical protein HDU91_004197 [Kappamyces sp. JEL0680]|nr:hypothetical protein HDU91_004197 [Kappamyces sp. JEL0680]
MAISNKPKEPDELIQMVRRSSLLPGALLPAPHLPGLLLGSIATPKRKKAPRVTVSKDMGMQLAKLTKNRKPSKSEADKKIEYLQLQRKKPPPEIQCRAPPVPKTLHSRHMKLWKEIEQTDIEDAVETMIVQRLDTKQRDRHKADGGLPLVDQTSHLAHTNPTAFLKRFSSKMHRLLARM